MSDLLEIAERCEKATGPDRELDLAIQRALSGNPWHWLDSRAFEPETVITWDQYGAGAVGNPVCDLEAYTASIDAAMTLGDPAGEISLSTLYGIARVEYPLNFADHGPYSSQQLGGLIAPAICAVMLRALAGKIAITEGEQR